MKSQLSLVLISPVSISRASISQVLTSHHSTSQASKNLLGVKNQHWEQPSPSPPELVIISLERILRNSSSEFVILFFINIFQSKGTKPTLGASKFPSQFNMGNKFNLGNKKPGQGVESLLGQNFRPGKNGQANQFKPAQSNFGSKPLGGQQGQKPFGGKGQVGNFNQNFRPRPNQNGQGGQSVKGGQSGKPNQFKPGQFKGGQGGQFDKFDQFKKQNQNEQRQPVAKPEVKPEQ